jgi:hypothetical protein
MNDSPALDEQSSNLESPMFSYFMNEDPPYRSVLLAIGHTVLAAAALEKVLSISIAYRRAERDRLRVGLAGLADGLVEVAGSSRPVGPDFMDAAGISALVLARDRILAEGKGELVVTSGRDRPSGIGNRRTGCLDQYESPQGAQGWMATGHAENRLARVQVVGEAELADSSPSGIRRAATHTKRRT